MYLCVLPTSEEFKQFMVELLITGALQGCRQRGVGGGGASAPPPPILDAKIKTHFYCFHCIINSSPPSVYTYVLEKTSPPCLVLDPSDYNFVDSGDLVQIASVQAIPSWEATVTPIFS